MTYNTIKDLFVGICDSIRARKGTTEPINHQDIPSEIASIENYYDTFWDSFQDNGNMDNYDYGIMGMGWNETTFKPKYPLIFVGKNTYIFAKTNIVDLRKCVDVLDFTHSTDTNYIFIWSNVKYCPRVIIGKQTTINGTFPYAEKLETVEEIIFNEDNANFPRFDYCYELREINASGVIVKSIILQHSSKLTVECAKNIISHLKDYSSSDSMLYTQTLTFHADVWARLEELDELGPTGSTWRDTPMDLGWLTA